MTDTMSRPDGAARQAPRLPPPHPHFTLGSIALMSLVVALIAGVIAIAALIVVGNRNSVDDDIVAAKVDQFLAAPGNVGTPSDTSPAPTAGAPATGTVIPDLTPKAELPVATEVNVAVAPNVPPPVTRTNQAIVEVHFEIVEGIYAIDPATGVDYETWGYKISGAQGDFIATPGPMIRARVGDVLRFTISNPATNSHPHNVDFHAVTGQGGGAADTSVAPGETTTIEARLLYPGMFMYHCATGDVPNHIVHGMYGGILVDPADPLPSVAHEWYVVQSEYYTTSTEPGLVETDRAAVTAEHPSMVVFNGAKGAIAGDNALQMNVGETARFYFVNAGLNLDSNFHPIGSHWDTVYQEAALLNRPLRGSQTTLVPAGGATVVELIGQVPSTILLVDHALARTFDKGALGMVVINGSENHEIFEAGEPTVVEAGPEHEDEEPTGPAEQVAIGVGAFAPQDLDAADEFADNEDPADYSVNVLRVKVGTTVNWTNNDGIVHTVTAVDGSFDSGFLGEAESWSHTFDTVGEFEYFCIPHPWMRAMVIVEA
ncbi:MAG: plastocyanin/azurin family copper-binding protein [Acidimicrobiia bacterium]